MSPVRSLVDSRDHPLMAQAGLGRHPRLTPRPRLPPCGGALLITVAVISRHAQEHDTSGTARVHQEDIRNRYDGVRVTYREEIHYHIRHR